MDEERPFRRYEQIAHALELYEQGVVKRLDKGERPNFGDFGNAMALLGFGSNARGVGTLNTSGLKFYGSLVALEKVMKQEPYDEQAVRAAVDEVELRRPIIELSLAGKLTAA